MDLEDFDDDDVDYDDGVWDDNYDHCSDDNGGCGEYEDDWQSGGEERETAAAFLIAVRITINNN